LLKELIKEFWKLEKTRYLIKYDCDYGKAPSSYEQGQKRFLARDKLVESFNGVREVFDEQIFQIFLELTAFDESVRTSATSKPQETRHGCLLLEKQTNKSIKIPLRLTIATLEELSNGILEGSNQRF
jgi:hypothetical protein